MVITTSRTSNYSSRKLLCRHDMLIVIKGAKGEYLNQIIGFVHIDDVVATHLLAMEESKASERLICSGPVAHQREVIEMLRTKYPMYPYETKKFHQQFGYNVN